MFKHVGLTITATLLSVPVAEANLSHEHTDMKRDAVHVLPVGDFLEDIGNAFKMAQAVPLPQTISAEGPIDLAAMWKTADALIGRAARVVAAKPAAHLGENPHRRHVALAHRHHYVRRYAAYHRQGHRYARAD